MAPDSARHWALFTVHLIGYQHQQLPEALGLLGGDLLQAYIEADIGLCRKIVGSADRFAKSDGTVDQR